MQAGEECAEEVVDCDGEGVEPLPAVVELEGGILFRILNEGKA